MEKLYVLYDPKCQLCCRLKDWLLEQQAWIGLRLVPPARQRRAGCFLNSKRWPDRMTWPLISDEGAVYLNDRAWIMFSTRSDEYRDWAPV